MKRVKPLEMRDLDDKFHSFVHNPYSTLSNEKTFLQEVEASELLLIFLEELFPQCNMHSDIYKK